MPAISQKSWTLGGAGAGVLLVGLTYLFGVGPALSHNSSVKSQTAAASDSNELLRIKANSLQAQSKKLDTMVSTLGAARTELPTAGDLPAFTRQINTLVASDALVLTSLDFSPPTIVSATGASAPATGVSAAGQLFQIPVTLVATGSVAASRNLVADLHRPGARAVLIKNVQIATDAKGKATTTVAVNIFVTPQTAAAEAALRKELK